MDKYLPSMHAASVSALGRDLIAGAAVCVPPLTAVYRRRLHSPPLPRPSPRLHPPAVHFVGRLAESGEIFMDTRLESQTEEPQVVVAGRRERSRCHRRARLWACLVRVCWRVWHAVHHPSCSLLTLVASHAGSRAKVHVNRLHPLAQPPQPPRNCARPADAATHETGLSLAVERMRCGGRARVWAAPEYGYGARGSFSFPTVPPNAHLV